MVDILYYLHHAPYYYKFKNGARMARVLWVQNLWLEYYGVMVISSRLKERGHQLEIVFGSKGIRPLSA